ncbi:hypothetical protein CEB3_c36630 [Peptococcaceae bacterium CEB3]|nr:hypothetical protein CEB3_c36630 [Peptococcaceae bacterium CEB3]
MSTLELGNNRQAEPTAYSVIQHNLENVGLTGPEIGELWATYMAESMTCSMLPFFVAKVKDPDIHRVLQQHTLDKSAQHLNSIREIFTAANFPLPHGFTDEDFDVNAKPLVSDTFILLYASFMAKSGMLNFSLAFSSAARPDVRAFFENCLNDSQESARTAHEVLLAKGLFPRAPYVPTPDRTEYVHDVQSFYKGFLGDKRPINALEIEHIFANVVSMYLRNTMTSALEQVTKSKLVKDYLERLRRINDKQIDILEHILEDADLATPTDHDHHVTESLESPFSDKLVLFHLTVVTAYAITGYGLALANCTRSDIILTFSRFIFELGDCAKDGVNLMIKQGWLERVPEAANRKELSSQ